MPVIAGPMPLTEVDEFLSGPAGAQFGLARTKTKLPWTLNTSGGRDPPDDDPAVEIFQSASPHLRALWESSVSANDSTIRKREYIVYHDISSGTVARFTYGEVERQVQQIAHSLAGLGLRKGDRVGIAMRNLPEYLPTWWATVSMGYIAVLLNAWLTKPELEWCIKDAGCRALFLDEERLHSLGGKDGKGLFDSLKPKGPIEHIIPIRCALSHLPSSISAVPYKKLLNPSHPRNLPPVDLSPFDSVQIIFSSGTTGHPKGILQSHIAWAQQAASSRYNQLRAVVRNGMDIPAMTPGAVPPQMVTFIPVPLFHVTGLGIAVASSAGGGKLILTSKWDAPAAVNIIESESVNMFVGVPTMAIQMISAPNFVKEKLASLMSLGYGGGPAPPALRDRVKGAFKGSGGEPGNIYGATEALGVAFNSGPDYAEKPDSVGKPMPFIKVEIRSLEGKVLPPGEVGEVWIKSVTVAKGYWNNEKATKESFKGGWYATGDIGRMDSEGFLYLLDRAKDMLIRGGENVYCSEVEAALLSHPDVMEASVFGIPHRTLNEDVGAAVRLHPSATNVTAAALRAHCAERIAKFKVPVYIAFWEGPLPSTATGKILKREVKEIVGKAAAREFGGEFAAKL
ncbi:acetyl-CoA synthetase-like protein [Gonapodya prolifera JEL478]|uniref:Acetyl-CoA synthetase-like protein n=1 Tax=Gonapodya prolifera (strain JEL478) TaxID=1344416 RepID=A0A139AZL6_GONPJ|nr:acetyl-CoA synthetase-like protein [Gonapodya prolifera JEL478]|eukprot:KXS22181.1 acetyl-CoA synthetase-like protein [Gonapodya prolifera JEL478]